MIIDHLLNYNSVTLLACNVQFELISHLKAFDIAVTAIDYDPKFANDQIYRVWNTFEHKENYIVKDFIFDKVEFGECVVNFNCEKTYPIGRIYKGDMVLIGDNDQHNGDCNPISSFEQLIEQNKITEVFEQYQDDKHFIVYGTNIS